MYFNTLLNVPYLLLEVSFVTKPTDVPAAITRTLCPIEYNSKSSNPLAILPSFATIESNTISTGVEHGDENIPPRTPATKAPI